jgi:hypothetical protein
LTTPQPFPPGAVAPPAGFDQAPPPKKKTGPDGKLIGGIITAVVGAGALVTFGVAQGQIASLQDDPGFDAYRRGFTASHSACDEAAAGRNAGVKGASDPATVDDLCSEAKAYEIVSYVMLPAGVALLGVGGYLIFTSDTVRRTTASIEIVPRAGLTSAGADLVVRY